MSLIPRNSLFDLDRFFSDDWPQSAATRAGTFFAPRVDIEETADHYEISAELPGIGKDDIHVHVRDGILTLEAESAREENEEQKGRVIRRERRFGKYMRSFNLGTDVQEDQIQASFQDGVLTLKAPKVIEQEPERRRIEIH